MKKLLAAISPLLLLAPVAAHAEDGDKAALEGFHLGIDGFRDSLEANQPTSTRDVSRKGYGGRVNAGYDVVLGNIILVGAEIGAGIGGKTVDQPSLLAGGRYKVDPGLSYDATARLGIAPGGKFAIYGRAGYRWLRTQQSVTGQATGNFNRKETERGFTYGGGVEFAATESLSLRAEFNRTKFSDNLRQNKISLGAAIRF